MALSKRLAVLAAVAFALSACGQASTAVSPTPLGSAPPRPSASATATMPSPETSAAESPTEPPTDPPLEITPLPSFGAPSAPAGSAFTASLAAETMGRATRTVRQWTGPTAEGPVVQTAELSMPCLWTSAKTVRGAFYQRVRILGQNDVLTWSAGVRPDGSLGGVITIFVDGPAMATVNTQWPSEPVAIRTADGFVSGTLTFRSLQLRAELTAVGDVDVNGSIDWDCGTPPAGVPATAPPAASGSVAGSVTIANEGATRPMQPGCPGTYSPPDGTMGPMPNCGETWSEVVAANRLAAAPGASPVISTGRARLLSAFSRARFVTAAAATSPEHGLVVPDGAPETPPAAASANGLTFKAPAKGDWYVFVDLICLDDAGNLLEYSWVGRILVE